jgi:hypothetical protein
MFSPTCSCVRSRRWTRHRETATRNEQESIGVAAIMFIFRIETDATAADRGATTAQNAISARKPLREANPNELRGLVAAMLME